MTAGHDAVDEISAAWQRERPDLDTSSIGIVTRIWRIGRLLDRHRDRTLAELGIDASTLDLLSTLRRAGPPYALTPTTIAARTLLTTGAVSQRVAKAEAAGLEIVGYTIGNDVSSRDIEGENPLYLPQAKVYRQCCALGPAILVETEGAEHRDLGAGLRIERQGRLVFAGETSTERMKRPEGYHVHGYGSPLKWGTPPDKQFGSALFYLVERHGLTQPTVHFPDAATGVTTKPVTVE